MSEHDGDETWQEPANQAEHQIGKAQNQAEYQPEHQTEAHADANAYANADINEDAPDSADSEPHSRRVRRRMSAEHIRRIKRKRRNRRILIAVVAVLLALAAFAVAFVWSVMSARSELQQAVASAKGLQSTITQADSRQLDTKVNEFSGHVDKAYKQTSSFLWTVASHVPYVGDDVSAVRTTVASLEDISSQALPQLAKVSKNVNLSNIHVENGTVSLPGLEDSQEPLSVADKVIDNSTREIKAAKRPHIHKVADALDSAQTYCAKLNSTVHTLNTVAQLLPGMLGTDSHANDAPRNYLILAQTNAEARPSGGLTGSLGVVTVQGGHLSMQPFVSDADIPKADEPVVELTAEEKMLFTNKLGTDIRDVNFTPDFPRTGEIVRAMWAKQYGVQVDGVLAIDPLFLQNMLAVTGGVTMPDGSVLDGTNTAQTLLNTVYAKMTPAETDKYFADAAQAAFDHITQNSGDPKAYINALSQSVKQGHLLLWSAHEDEQDLIAESDISGRLITEGAKPQVGVYISDETQSKMDWYLHREVTTEFQKVAANGANQYTVHIKMKNLMTTKALATAPNYVTGGTDGTEPGDIRTALFLYAPANGRLVDWKFQNQNDYQGVTVHDGLTLAVGKVTLKPGEEYEITLHVQSAPNTKNALTVRQTPLIEGR